MVARRTFEIGLRVALGAQQGDVFRLIVRRGLMLAVIGLVVGIGGFAIFGRVVADMLYGVRAFEPSVIGRGLCGDVGGGVCGECGAGLEGGAVGADGGVAGGVRTKLIQGLKPLIG